MKQVLICKQCKSKYNYPSGVGCFYWMEIIEKSLQWGGCDCEGIHPKSCKFNPSKFFWVDNKLASLFYL